MNNKVLFRVMSVAIALLLVGLILFWVRTKQVSLLLVNGKVYTVNDRQPVAEAVAIDKGLILHVGTTKEVESMYTGSRVIDLHGKPVYPGFIDSHAHLENLGVLLHELNLDGTTSLLEICEMVGKEIAGRPAGSWIIGRGWDQNRWSDKHFPTHAILDRVAPRNPVYLVRVDGHAVWVNQRAMDLAKIGPSTRDPAGGRILRDEAGKPTGVFVDNAIGLLSGALPEPTESDRMSSVARAVHECLRYGLTEVHDMGVDSEGIEIYRKMIEQGKFPFRVYVALENVKDLWDRYRRSGPELGGYGGSLTIRALKLYADGALGSRGAALIEPYSDDPGNRGLTLTGEPELRDVAKEALDAGFQVCVHAIGDRANVIVLNAYDAVLGAGGGKSRDARFRIEHAQVLDPADIPRFHKLGVLPSMQPTHATSDMPWAEARLGSKRILGAYAWRSLLNTGAIIPAGSDFPVESPDPLRGFYAAITRQDAHGDPPGGWYPEQCMTREEALKAFTIWGAYAAFQENVKGSIEPGKWADLVVLTDDIMTIEPPKILTSRVVMTMIAGVEVYTADTSAARGASSPPGPTR